MGRDTFVPGKTLGFFAITLRGLPDFPDQPARTAALEIPGVHLFLKQARFRQSRPANARREVYCGPIVGIGFSSCSFENGVAARRAARDYLPKIMP